VHARYVSAFDGKKWWTIKFSDNKDTKLDQEDLEKAWR